MSLDPSSSGRRFWTKLDEKFPNFSSGIETEFLRWLGDLQYKTFVMSLTEHSEEIKYGRLSLWRGYSGETPVALVLDPRFLEIKAENLSVYCYPIFYKKDDEVRAIFKMLDLEIIKRLPKFRLATLPDVKAATMNVLKTIAFSFKHPGFAEENE